MDIEYHLAFGGDVFGVGFSPSMVNSGEPMTARSAIGCFRDVI
jgi:hypothetical protein